MATTNASAKAEDLKAKGNEKYQADQLEDAIKLYQEAATLQPTEPVRIAINLGVTGADASFE